jgi:hypothetical protein
MKWLENCVFIDEASFNIHLRRNFGRSKRGQPAKAKVPSNRGISISILGAICEKGVIDLTLRRPHPVQKRIQARKNVKETTEKKRPSLRLQKWLALSEYLLEFIEGVMDTLDDHNMKGKAICDLLCNEKHAVTYR